MDDYKELLPKDNAGVRFLVVGGYAAIAHGLTRATDDLDIWIDPTLDSAKKAVGALEQFGTPVDGGMGTVLQKSQRRSPKGMGTQSRRG